MAVRAHPTGYGWGQVSRGRQLTGHRLERLRVCLFAFILIRFSDQMTCLTSDLKQHPHLSSPGAVEGMEKLKMVGVSPRAAWWVRRMWCVSHTRTRVSTLANI